MVEQPDAYGVWDTQENCWFFKRTKRAWITRSAAANAWNSVHRIWTSGIGYSSCFSEQDRFVTKGIRFVALD